MEVTVKKYIAESRRTWEALAHINMLAYPSEELKENLEQSSQL